jgi:hypothetical protein
VDVRLNLASRPPIVELRQPTEFDRFHVRVVGEDEPAVANVAFARYGRIIDRDTAWVKVEGVRELAEGVVDGEWEQGFERMLDAAADRGWIDEARTEIKAHIDWP